MAVAEIIEYVLSLELNESSSMSAQSSHNRSSSNAKVPMEGDLAVVSTKFPKLIALLLSIIPVTMDHRSYA
ncbi:hypothetical protein TIFTF001_028624 [Ficus carica]|uniref:Uncharacterized protein n=1 Tax=Ficus carica TaxID=3494 RepID=A0AA88DQA3_FICCA|nr:hypothetical protein TIFTF001_028624 [Ficus carica]